MSQPLDDGTNFCGQIIPWFRAYFIGVTPELLVGIIIPKKLEKASGYKDCRFYAEARGFEHYMFGTPFVSYSLRPVRYTQSLQILF